VAVFRIRHQYQLPARTIKWPIFVIFVVNGLIDVVKKGSWTYQLETVRCGKEGCHCNEETAHGPYWYGYRRENGRTKSKYIGKDLTKALK
jgi:Family of unknown function (DUF6788)